MPEGSETCLPCPRRHPGLHVIHSEIISAIESELLDSAC